jgi:hypothetical protein
MDANWTRTVSQKVTTYQMLASDNRSVIEGNHATTPFTVTLPAVATAAAEDTGDFEVTVTNINAAVVSVDASGSETIDGSVSTIDLEQWESVTIKLDSADTGWKTIAQYQQKLRPVADTAAGDSAAVGYTAAEGLVLTGQGSGADVTIKNDADGTVLRVPTGTTNIDIRGNIDLGAAGNAGQIVHQTNGESIEIAGGAATTAGGGIFMYAADNSLFPGDVAITNDGNFVAHWDESAGDWTFFSGTGTPTEGLNLDLNQNLTVGNGTQPAPEVRINGAATADPALELQQDGAVKAYFQYQDSGDITRIDGDGQVIIASANTAAITIDTSQNITTAGTINGQNLGVTQATNHTRAGNTQIINGDQTNTPIDVDSVVTESAFETVGPTGSGATNIWADMDSIPSTGAVLIVDVYLDITTSGTGLASVNCYACSNSVSPAVDIENNSIASVGIDSTASGVREFITKRAFIPLDSSQIFKVSWSDSGSSSTNVQLFYRGFITD